MGGNAFTEEIQKQLNISYDEAEALKVGGQGETDAVVPQEVERVIQGVAEQMAGEIQRSLDFYAVTAADSRISRVYLSGGTARIPALFKVIEARAGVPVEILNPFKNIEIDNRQFDPAVILAAAPARRGRRRPRAAPPRGQVTMVRINLLPVRVSKKKEAGQQQLVIFAGVLLLGLVGNYIWASSRAGDLARPREAKLRTHPRRHRAARADHRRGAEHPGRSSRSCRQKLDVLDKLKQGRTGPVRMLDDLATIIPRQLWLTKMEEKAGKVTFQGTAASIDDVSAFMTALKDSQLLRQGGAQEDHRQGRVGLPRHRVRHHGRRPLLAGARGGGRRPGPGPGGRAGPARARADAARRGGDGGLAMEQLIERIGKASLGAKVGVVAARPGGAHRPQLLRVLDPVRPVHLGGRAEDHRRRGTAARSSTRDFIEKTAIANDLNRFRRRRSSSSSS